MLGCFKAHLTYFRVFSSKLAARAFFSSAIVTFLSSYTSFFTAISELAASTPLWRSGQPCSSWPRRPSLGTGLDTSAGQDGAPGAGEEIRLQDV